MSQTEPTPQEVEAARQAGTTFEEQMRLDPDEYAAHGGGFPITVRGVGVVGVVTVSGLPQLEDHALSSSS